MRSILFSLFLTLRAVAAPTFTDSVDAYFEDYFKDSPTAATAAGVHKYDSEVADHSRPAIDARIAAQKAQLKVFEAMDPKVLSQDDGIDLELITNAIHAELLDLEVIRTWQRDPDRYSSGVTESIYGLMSRRFAPADARLRSVIAREKHVPATFAAARENLKNPPQIYTEIALEQLPGIISFFEKDVPSAFAEVKDKVLLKEFQQANQAVIKEVKAYGDFLKQDLLARSKGDFRIGADAFYSKLRFEELVDIPLDKLLEIGLVDLKKNQIKFRETALKLSPKKTYEQVLKDLEKDHPKPKALLKSVRNVMGGLRKFLIDKKIVTVPSQVEPIIQETPPFERALVFASMDTPGPFEATAKEAYYNITLPEPSWDKTRVEEHMAGFNYATIISTSVHEAYPGHYIQFLWVQRAPSKTRKLLGANSNSEGWAHYTEQMMLDEGYGKGDLTLRLGQLQDALLRNARFVVGLQMHRGKMTFAEGIDYFIKEGFTSRANAERETKRGTSDPTYLYYTLGKLQILKLREDYRKMKGAAFTLQEFHDNLLKQGFPPIKLLRRALLGEDGAVL